MLNTFKRLDSFQEAKCAFSTWFYNQVKWTALNWITKGKTEKRGRLETLYLSDEENIEENRSVRVEDSGFDDLITKPIDNTTI